MKTSRYSSILLREFFFVSKVKSLVESYFEFWSRQTDLGQLAALNVRENKMVCELLGFQIKQF